MHTIINHLICASIHHAEDLASSYFSFLISFFKAVSILHNIAICTVKLLHRVCVCVCVCKFGFNYLTLGTSLSSEVS